MLNKKELEVMTICSQHSCSECMLVGKCAYDIAAQTALQLLERVETAETILRDILQSGNVTACRKEIEEFLEEG